MELHSNSRMNRNLAGSRAARRSPIISGCTFRWNRRATITGDEAMHARAPLYASHREVVVGQASVAACDADADVAQRQVCLCAVRCGRVRVSLTELSCP
jgi:hypothetical protein